MTGVARKIAPAPPLGALVRLPFGGTDVVATVLEDRGPLGIDGRHLVRVRFFLEGTADPVETEVPAEDLSIVALPSDRASKRVGVEAVGDAWVGTYTAPDGRVAVVTAEMPTRERAREAALHWVQVGTSEKVIKGRSFPFTAEPAYKWEPDPDYPGRYRVFRESRLGRELVREPGREYSRRTERR
jgi:hypothetical protein